MAYGSNKVPIIKEKVIEILSEFTVLTSTTVNVPEGLGFHLRPSTLVAKISNHYSSKLLMIVNGKEFDAVLITIGAAMGIVPSLPGSQLKGNINAID